MSTSPDSYYPDQQELPNPLSDRDIVIPAWRLGAVQARVEKLRRKEAKLLGADTFGIEVAGLASIWTDREPNHADAVQFSRDRDEHGLAEAKKLQRQRRRVVEDAVVIELRGVAPVVPGGWSLVGVVTQLGEACVVTQVPGTDEGLDLTQFRTADRLRCDHCQLARRRNEHFVVVDEAGELKLVGRQCLQDFLGGHTPEKLIAWAKLLRYLSTACDASHEEEDGEYFRDHSPLFVLPFVAIVCAWAREHGFITAKAAQDSDLSSTKSCALDQYWSRRFDPKRHVHVTDEDRAEAAAAIEWAKALEGKTEFEYNLRAVAEAGSIPQRAIRRLAGIAAYLPQAVKRGLERQIAREREIASRPESKHLGEPKQRLDLTLRKVAEYQTEGNYGTTWIEKFETPDGDQVTWFASNPRVVPCDDTVEGSWDGKRALAIGESAILKATVKKHDEYKGRKVTVITRAKLVSLVEEEKAS